MAEGSISGLPWKAINDFVLHLGSAETKSGLFDIALAGIDEIVDFDSACGVFDQDRRAIRTTGMLESADKLYNGYYRFIQKPYCEQRERQNEKPAFLLLDHCINYGVCSDDEYYVDFARPNGLEWALLAPLPNSVYILSTNRSRASSRFSDNDYFALRIVNEHMNNLCSIFDKASSRESTAPSAEELRFRFPALSKREAEVASCLCLGLTAPEIGTKLFISERTVEAHVAHVYDKLDVRTRRAAVALLRGTDPRP